MSHPMSDIADALREIAKQKLREELLPEQAYCADFEGGYEACIKRARSALAALQPPKREATDHAFEPSDGSECAACGYAASAHLDLPSQPPGRKGGAAAVSVLWRGQC
jgi:hypothetical protein